MVIITKMSLIFGFYQICWEFKKSLKKWIKTSAIMEDKKKKRTKGTPPNPTKNAGELWGISDYGKKISNTKIPSF